MFPSDLTEQKRKLMQALKLAVESLTRIDTLVAETMKRAANEMVILPIAA